MNNTIQNITEDLRELDAEDLRLLQTVVSGLAMTAPSTERRMETTSALADLMHRQQSAWEARESTAEPAKKEKKTIPPIHAVVADCLPEWGGGGRYVEVCETSHEAQRRLYLNSERNPVHYTLEGPHNVAAVVIHEDLPISAFYKAMNARGWTMEAGTARENMQKAGFVPASHPKAGIMPVPNPIKL